MKVQVRERIKRVSFDDVMVMRRLRDFSKEVSYSIEEDTEVEQYNTTAIYTLCQCCGTKHLIGVAHNYLVNIEGWEGCPDEKKDMYNSWTLYCSKKRKYYRPLYMTLELERLCTISLNVKNRFKKN